MRLLPKSEILQQKANARRMDIDEGKKIARRIDNLREVAVEEERSLEEFRKKNVAKIHADLRKENDVLNAVKKEVRTLEKRRVELLKPLDKEWEAINSEKESINIQKDALITKEITLQNQEKQLKQAVRQASDSLSRATTREERAEILLRETSEDRKDARLLYKDAQKTDERARRLEEVMTKELHERDMELASKERDATMREAKLHDGESALKKGWALLEDRKSAFERQITRANKKKSSWQETQEQP